MLAAGCPLFPKQGPSVPHRHPQRDWTGPHLT